MKITQLRKLIQEVLDEVSIDEMARQAGTGSTYTISEDGKSALKKIKQTGEVPEGVRMSDLKVLKMLFKKDGQALSQIEVAKAICEEEGGTACQQMVNGSFKKLETLGYVDKSSYEKKGPSGGGAKGGQKLSDFLSDLDI
jgi:hypothetical protein